MASFAGKDMLIKLEISGTFTTIAGLRSTSITANKEMVDITNKDSSGVRTLLAGAGINSLTISGSGVLTDDPVHDTLEGLRTASTISDFQVVIGTQGTYEGPFEITSLEFSSEYNGEVTYSLTLESAGSITYT